MKPKTIILPTLAVVGAVLACGPFYSYRVLEMNNPTISPATSSISDMFPENEDDDPLAVPLDTKANTTLVADLADLKLAAPDLAPETFSSYKKLRAKMVEDYVTKKVRPWLIEESEPAQPDPDLAFITDLPKEFQLYLNGALAFYKKDKVAAQKHWQDLLDLPAAERKFRTTWAIWMLARTTKDEDKLQWLVRLDAELKNGARDSLDLAHSLEGLRARAQYRSGDYIPALHYYIKAGETGKILPHEAATSVKTVFRRALKKQKNDDFHEKLLPHPEIRKYFARYLELIQRFKFDDYHEDPKDGAMFAWISFLIDKNAELSSEEAGILSAACYRAQSDKLTTKLLAKVTTDTSDSLFIRAKLAVKNGDLAAAAKFYQQLIKIIDPTSKGSRMVFDNEEIYVTKNARTNQAYSEYAAVCLGLKQYEQALLHFLHAGNFDDAAYIAENLISAQELLAICKKHCHADAMDNNGSKKWIRAVLGRRLAREQFFKDAASYIPHDQLKKFDAYVTLYRQAHDKNLPRRQRGMQLWLLAQAHYDYGRDLFWLTNNCRPLERVKNAKLPMSDEMREHYSYVFREPDSQINPPISSDELARFKKYYTPIARPARHVYAAAEYAYQAAQLLPDNDPLTANILWRAGSWIKIGDPKKADKFYQALVRRCYKTPLGQIADKKRWFPLPDEIEENHSL